MKSFTNGASTMVAESLAGFVSAHETLVTFGTGRKCVRRLVPKSGKVAIVSGGGAGHEPMHAGFVGYGMLDAACSGHIFSSPTPDQIMTAVSETDTGEGCLLIVKNYDGDVMNFEMAAEMLGERHRIRTVVVRDDIHPDGSTRSHGRRGVAGTLVMEKLLGAAAEAGMSLDRLSDLGERLNGRIRTMGVSLSGVTLPLTRRETFSLEPHEIEVGVGIHGEPGRSREAFGTADAMVGRLCEAILTDGKPPRGSRALLFVNGFGATPVSELYLVHHVARRIFEAAGIQIARSLTGSYVTSLNMAGASVTLALMEDADLALWDAAVHTAALRWGM